MVGIKDIKVQSDIFLIVQEDYQKILFQVYNRPTSTITENDKRINYYDFIYSLKNKDCNEALKRMMKNIDMKKIEEEIDDMPIISDVRKNFYKVLLNKRYEVILKKAYDKLNNTQKQLFISCRKSSNDKHVSISFKEFLIAIGRENLIDEIQIHFDNNERMDKTIHELCLKFYRTYLVVGGMPEVVQTYLTEGKVIASIDVQAEILESYERDMTKYANNGLSNRIISTFDSIPAQLAKDNQKFQYKVILKGETPGIFGEAIMWLKNSGIVTQVYKASAELPLEMYKDLSSFKLYMSDVGLFVNKARYPLYQIELSKQPTMISMGPLTENYVANELRVKGYELYYWESNGKAELDFMIQKDTNIIPIEVKTSTHTKARSLDLYMKSYSPKYAIRISEKNFGFENNIKSVPLYAVFCI